MPKLSAPLFVLLLVLWAPPAAAQKARIDVLGEGTERGVEIRAITADRIVYRTADGEERRASLDDLVSLAFANEARPPAGYEPQEVELVLRDGDVVRGSLLPGEQDRVSLSSRLLGRIDLLVDAVREIRFLDALEEATENPSPGPESPELDHFYYRTLDHLEGTYARTTADAIVVRRADGATRSIGFDDLLSIRFADWPAPGRPEERVAILLLADGSRVTARGLRSDGRRLRATTIRDEAVDLALGDLVAVTMKGGRFVYLSDLEPSETKITPWLGEVRAWDRPRFDRSFVDQPLRAGGERYLKGIGVLSGTELTFRLDDRYSRFTSLIALDDAAGEEGDVVFEVLVDGETRFTSGTVRRLARDGEPLRIPDVDLTGAEELTLRVSWVDDFVTDFADWLDPMLIPQPMTLARPEALLLLLPAGLLVALFARFRRRLFPSRARAVLATSLRLLALAAFVIAVAGPYSERTASTPGTTVLVADRSASIPSAAGAAIDTTRARLAAAELPFGDADGSDARPALLRAGAGDAERIVLLTDGRTAGGEELLLGDLRARGAAVGVVPVGEPPPARPAPPARPRIVPPEVPHPGELRPLEVRADGADRVRLTVDGAPAGVRAVREGVARFPDLELPPGPHEVVAVATGPGGSSVAARDVDVPGPLPVLVLAPEAGGPVARALAAQDLEVRTATALPPEVPARVVVALPGADLGPTADRLASFVRSGGGLFLATGAPPGLAELEATPLAGLLPARARPAPPEAAPPPDETPPPAPEETPPDGASPAKVEKEAYTVSVLLVMDRSGSMAGEKILIARASCVATAGTLAPDDRLGVLAFSDETEWIRRFSPAGDLPGLRQALSRLTPGGGTEIFPAIREAFREIRRETSAIRHVILVSDGQDVLVGFKPLLDEMRKERITLSAIGIGTDFEFNFLSSLAEWGGGGSYFATNPRELVALITRDTRRVLERRDAKREPPSEDVTAGSPEPAEPEPERPPEPPPVEPVELAAPPPLPFLEGLSFPPLPETEPVEPRFPAVTALAAADGTPVLTFWRHGEGRVAHLAADPAAWAEWPDLGRFLGQLAQFLAGSAGPDVPALRIRVVDGQVLVRAGEPPAGRAATVPGGDEVELRFRRTGPGEYSAVLPPAPAGALRVFRVSTPRGGRALAAAIAPASAESGTGRDPAALDLLARAAGRPVGRIPPPPAPGERPERHPRDLPFLVVGLVLLVLDTAARRVGA